MTTDDIPYAIVRITAEWSCGNCDEDMEITDEVIRQDQSILCTNCNAKHRAMVC
jgi:DNA-directed RNA polymerase subunit RPC12/RpoP